MWRFRTKDASGRSGERLFLMRFYCCFVHYYFVFLLLFFSFFFLSFVSAFAYERRLSVERFTCWTGRCPATRCDPTARTAPPSRRNRWGSISDCSRTISGPAKRWWSSLDFWDSERANERFRRVHHQHSTGQVVRGTNTISVSWVSFKPIQTVKFSEWFCTGLISRL